MKGFEILIEDIPDEGLEIEAAEGDVWLAEAVREAIGEEFDEPFKAQLSLSIFKVEGNVNLEGEMLLITRRECDRCLERFDENITVPLHTVLAPLYESERQREREGRLGAEVVKEDLEFGFYEGDRFDLAEVVRELVALAIPMKHLCRDDCKGLCQKCGKDLNEGPCGCPQVENKGAFEALKKLKTRKS